MNDEGQTVTLDARFASRPHTYKRLQQIADIMNEAMAQGCTADQVERLPSNRLKNSAVSCWIELSRSSGKLWSRAKRKIRLERTQPSRNA